jgi:protoheme IX farnesyltransferase
MIVKTSAISLSHLQMRSWSRLAARLPDFVALMKPRVMALAVFTSLVGMTVAPGELDALRGFSAVLGIAAGAGAAGALNMWFEADIDAVMTRTAGRPIPRGKITPFEALVFGLGLACMGIAVLGFMLNATAAALLALAILIYAVVYTAWLKRRTPQNIVIGGAAGALPPVIGWAAACGEIGLEPLVLFLMIFLWTPPHFWALALDRADEYARANIPVLPVVAGKTATARQMLIYSVLLVPVSVLPWVLGSAGMIYGATAAVCGTIFIALAIRLNKSGQADFRAARRLFVSSISYLFLLFAALLADHTGTPPLSMPSSRNFWPALASLRAESLPCPAGAACICTTARTNEI